MTQPVLIVGAGPTGLAMAIELARYGVEFRIIDKALESTPYSKAIGLQARTLEYFQRIGLAERFVEEGRRIDSLSVYDRGMRVAHIPLGGLASAYPFILTIPQPRTEALLTERLQSLGVALERGTELIAFRQDAEGVVATLKRADGTTVERSFLYLMGCDGAHSAVRTLAQIPFEGTTVAEEGFALADVRVGSPYPDDEVCTFFDADRLTAFYPLPGGRCRVAWVAPAGASQTTPPELAEAQDFVDRNVPGRVVLSDPAWLARFRVNQRKARRYRDGRTFLLGDAAHIHSPAGAQGMNTGIADAVNLAWKLALVLDGRAEVSLLDSYDAERGAVGEQVLKLAGAGFIYLHAAHPLERGAIDAAAHALTSNSTFDKQVGSRLAQLTINYEQSAVVRDDGAILARWLHGARAGDRAPDAIGMSGGAAIRIYDLIDSSRHVLLVFDDADAWDDVAACCAAHETYVTPYFVASSDQAAPRGIATIVDADNTIARAYEAEAGALFLIRPDAYIAFRSGTGDTIELGRYLERIFRNTVVQQEI